MRISTIGYCLKQGVKNIWRNKIFSLASITTMSACIFLFGIFYCAVENFQNVVKEAESNLSVTVFFEYETTDEAMKDVGEKIEARSEVSYVEFVSAEQAWEETKETYFADAPELAEGFADDNPMANSAHYVIYLNDVDEQANLVTYLESVESIRKINKAEDVANILSNFNILVGYVSIAVIILLLCVSIFLISNTVTIGIAVRKEEIAIMRLIGATNMFIKAPFVVEGMLIGFVGALIPLGVLYVVYMQVVEYVLTEFQILTGIIQFLPVGEMFMTLIPIGLALGMGIGFFGSFFTIRKHLKV